jgi:two-component system cell cycle response regulator DivK
MTMTVLVIEDSAVNMKLVTMLLRKEGYEVLQARTAEEGLSLARAKVPDLVLMDVNLPGVDGLQATRILKSDDRTRAVPVIAVTALAMEGDEEKIRAAGCDGYVAKPIRYKQFLQEVANVLRSRASKTT